MGGDALSRSVREERLMLLAHRDQLVRALNQIIALIDEAESEIPAEDALTEIHDIAEAALKL